MTRLHPTHCFNIAQNLCRAFSVPTVRVLLPFYDNKHPLPFSDHTIVLYCAVLPIHINHPLYGST